MVSCCSAASQRRRRLRSRGGRQEDSQQRAVAQEATTVTLQQRSLSPPPPPAVAVAPPVLQDNTCAAQPPPGTTCSGVNTPGTAAHCRAFGGDYGVGREGQITIGGHWVEAAAAAHVAGFKATGTVRRQLSIPENNSRAPCSNDNTNPRAVWNRPVGINPAQWRWHH